ncbi:MAG TPA: hypothetical protein VL854_04035, partial [Nitrososphaeraceae archaeon]|nr:hypothetical protein [Nitrososphaeraceae archaeon]
MVMNPTGQPLIQLSEVQKVSQFKLQLPTLPPFIGIQSAYADQSATFNDNLENDCQQSGTGANNEDCDITVTAAISEAAQDPPAGTSNQYDVIINLVALNNCDEFDDGNNNANCDNTATYVVGPVTQTNDPNNPPVATNEIDIVTDDTMLNDCTESGNGDNNAQCSNTGTFTIDSITQNNLVDASNTIGVNFAESNTVNVLSSFDETNDCDETGDGNLGPVCENAVTNQIGPIGQLNAVTGNTPNSAHTNNIDFSQTGIAENDCNESGQGAGINAARCGIEAANAVSGLDQINAADGVDNAVQSNDFTVSQVFDVENACNEFEEGTNAQNCVMDGLDNEIGDTIAMEQSNDAVGAAGATISQNNEVDGDDALGIAGITQLIVADNTCGQTGSGDNLVSCVINDFENDVDQIDQSNSVLDADDGVVVSQDNGAVISQLLSLENDCDENTFTDIHDNNANCRLDNDMENFLGNLFQNNQVFSALDNSVSNQDNNVAVSQDLLAENDCNGTGGNSVTCINNADSDINEINSIGQFNTATTAGDVLSDQNNDVSLAQSGSLVNTCDETGGGVNQATCQNVDDLSIIGPISQNNAVGALNSDTADQSNVAQVTQNLNAVNDCDEDGTGFNQASCSNELTSNNIDSITQGNDATVGDDTAQLNFVAVNQNLLLQNVCDETGIGDNAAICNDPNGNDNNNNFIGPVTQSNDAAGSGDADFTQNNSIPKIDQVIDAENDCDQSDEQTALGSNFARCSNDDPQNVIESIAQTNDADGTHVDDIFQDNTGSFSQVMTLNNGCDATTFTDNGDNSAVCRNEFADNIIDPVVQTNTATGLDDVLIDQDNNVDVTQVTSANNNCDSTGPNEADCGNLNAGNFIDDITQDNTANGDDFASITQSNDATINQKVNLLNSCDESGSGINSADCDNDALGEFHNHIGPIDQSNDATGAGNSVVSQSNVIDVTQNLQGRNDCDEANTGNNNAECSTEIFNNIDSITQTNDVASITGTDTETQSNVFTVKQNLVATNDCD